MLTLIRMIAAGSSDHDLLRAAADHGILHRRDQQVAQFSLQRVAQWSRQQVAQWSRQQVAQWSRQQVAVRSRQQQVAQWSYLNSVEGPWFKSRSNMPHVCGLYASEDENSEIK